MDCFLCDGGIAWEADAVGVDVWWVGEFDLGGDLCPGGDDFSGGEIGMWVGLIDIPELFWGGGCVRRKGVEEFDAVGCGAVDDVLS